MGSKFEPMLLTTTLDAVMRLVPEGTLVFPKVYWSFAFQLDENAVPPQGVVPTSRIRYQTVSPPLLPVSVTLAVIEVGKAPVMPVPRHISSKFASELVTVFVYCA